MCPCSWEFAHMIDVTWVVTGAEAGYHVDVAQDWSGDEGSVLHREDDISVVVVDDMCQVVSSVDTGQQGTGTECSNWTAYHGDWEKAFLRSRNDVVESSVGACSSGTLHASEVHGVHYLGLNVDVESSESNGLASLAAGLT